MSACISLADALKRLSTQLGSEQAAKVELAERLRWGDISARAGAIKNISKRHSRALGRDTNDVRHFENHPLDAGAWKRAAVSWTESSAVIAEDRLTVEISDIHLNEAAFRRLWPAVGCEKNVVSIKSAGGRPQKHDWDAFHREVIRIANAPDGLPDERSVLMRRMTEWWSDSQGTEFPVSQVRDRLAAIYKAAGKT